jgi:hypothetical protein
MLPSNKYVDFKDLVNVCKAPRQITLTYKSHDYSVGLYSSNIEFIKRELKYENDVQRDIDFDYIMEEWYGK